MTEKHECEYRYTGPLGDNEVCTLTGMACVCSLDWHHCTRREFANGYTAKRVATPRQFQGIILTDDQGQITGLM